MLISIIVATYNASGTIRNCLNSIIPQLNSECELILIDGKSVDDTNSIIGSYGDKITIHISEEDKGVYDAWNKGLDLASGNWIMFIGADDILLPDSIINYQNLISTIKDVDTYDYICAYNEYVDKNGKLLKVIGGAPKWSIYRRKMNAAHVASLHNKKNLFDKIGKFDLKFKICADYDLLLRKRDKMKWYFFPVHIARMEVGGMSFSYKAIIETYMVRKKNKTVSRVANMILFCIDCFCFKLFVIRKNIKGGAS